MINLVLFHSISPENPNLPGYVEYNLMQIRFFNPEVRIYFLTDAQLINSPIFTKYNVIALDKNFFVSDKVKQFESCFNYNSNDFWTLAATRLIYIENFLRKYNLQDVYHFENDVLLYYNLELHHEKFQNFYKNIAITTGGPDKSMTGFMFIKNYKSIEMMTTFFIETIKTYGIQGTMQKYCMDMVNEMSLMKFYGVEKGEDYIFNLPTLPFGDYSQHFSDFNSIFDPASWGQFVGGTRVEGPGAKPQDHYIGVLLKQNPTWYVEWKIENELKIPYFNKDGELVRINNLHIHSKNLNKYISK